MIQRRNLVAAALLAPVLPRPAWSQSVAFKRPLKMIVPLQAGGSADITTRMVGHDLQQRIKQSVIVENKPGGSFVIGMQALAMAPADGHTLISLNTGMVAAQVTMRRFDLLKSVALITQYSKTPTLFVVPAKSRFNSFSELVAYAKKHPKKLNYGSVGTGGLEHLWVTMLGQAKGADFTHIPFKGMPDALTALAQGELDFVPCVMSAALPFVQKGTLRALCVLSHDRIASMPGLPSMKEQGADIPPMEFWSGVAARQGTSPAVVEQLRQDLVAVLSEPELITRMADRGATVVTSNNAEAFKNVIHADWAWMSKVAQEAGIQVD